MVKPKTVIATISQKGLASTKTWITSLKGTCIKTKHKKRIEKIILKASRFLFMSKIKTLNYLNVQQDNGDIFKFKIFLMIYIYECAIIFVV